MSGAFPPPTSCRRARGGVAGILRCAGRGASAASAGIAKASATREGPGKPWIARLEVEGRWRAPRSGRQLVQRGRSCSREKSFPLPSAAVVFGRKVQTLDPVQRRNRCFGTWRCCSPAVNTSSLLLSPLGILRVNQYPEVLHKILKSLNFT